MGGVGRVGGGSDEKVDDESSCDACTSMASSVNFNIFFNLMPV